MNCHNCHTPMNTEDIEAGKCPYCKSPQVTCSLRFAIYHRTSKHYDARAMEHIETPHKSPPILEFSFDNGETWKKVETVNLKENERR